MLYVDTSVIVKLYFKERYSSKVSEWIKTNNEAIPLTSMHELEFINAVNLKRFRNEITKDIAEFIFSNFKNHEEDGVYFRPSINWPEVYQNTFDLSKEFTDKIGSRSLDIIHVAAALTLGADRFLTLDIRQEKLVSLTPMKVVNLNLSSTLKHLDSPVRAGE
ncbi:type II toxin-antitoxin system VapC family toxin [Thermodesulfobacteriota bacterium]